jgi:integrase
MLGTGLRIGEVLAVTWDELNLEARTVEVRATVVRKRGVGLVLQPRPKTRSGWRVLHLPPWLVELLNARPRVEMSGASCFRRIRASCGIGPTRVLIFGR